MDSAVVQDYVATLSSVPFSTFVEPAPFIPDPTYEAIFRQKQATEPYMLESASDTTSSIEISQTSLSSDEEIRDAVASYLNSAYFVDNKVAKLISDNLDELF